MGSFGERLRREREMRGITIEEIAEATKIGSRNLRALEEEKFDLLPGGIFNKGFVRAYSKFLGLDEEQAVADYISAETTFRSGSLEEPEAPVERESGSSKGLVLAVVVLLVIGGAGFGGWKYYQKRVAQRLAIQAAAAQAPVPIAPAAAVVNAPADPNAQPATTTGSDPNAATQPGSPAPANASAAAVTPVSATPTPVTTLAATAPAPENTADGFVVQIKAKQDSWVSAKADGKSVLSGTLKAADAKTLHAKDRIILTLGNVGGVQVTYNGKDLDLGGSTAGQVKKLVFTAQGLQPDAPEQR